MMDIEIVSGWLPTTALLGDPSYAAEHARVDVTYQAMRELMSAPHPAPQAQQAARDLTLALRAATEAVARRLQAVTSAPTPVARHRWQRRRSDRVVSAETRAWSAELVRLAEIGVWLRRATLDDLAVHVPTIVRVANYAATGPHIAGMGFGAHSTAGERCIGVDLTAIVDAAGRTGLAAPPAPVPTEHAPAVAA
ncbi:MAG TPA: hypothetical protein VG708_03005 [Mycobacteriales bacterium]|nr:hypothetical protein [Mycobacteriales bacterium]